MAKRDRNIDMAKSIVRTVCIYYGLDDITELAAPARAGLWRYGVVQEARAIACWLLQRHCGLSPEELQDTLKLQWGGAFIRLHSDMARKKLADGNYTYRSGVEGVERLMLSNLTRANVARIRYTKTTKGETNNDV